MTAINHHSNIWFARPIENEPSLIQKIRKLKKFEKFDNFFNLTDYVYLL